eukprot:GHVS01068913.1.p1 GENE.GHVS01068913.1~~GHVS01068913.1.p1  ORF type:complete len:260 (+),score=30.91 GHVS01068913.1:149-928(+)
MGGVWTSLSLVALGLEMFIDLLSSVAVMWRFGLGSDLSGSPPSPSHGQPIELTQQPFAEVSSSTSYGCEDRPTRRVSLQGSTEQLSPRDTAKDADSMLASFNQQVYLARRERIASLSIGVLFVALAVYVFADGIIDLVVRSVDPDQRWKSVVVVCAVSWPSALIFTGLGGWKLLLARRLNSQVVMKDAICSAFGVALSVVAGIAAAVELSSLSNPNVPEHSINTDSVAAILIALLIFVEGLRTVLENTISYKPPTELQM